MVDLGASSKSGIEGEARRLAEDLINEPVDMAVGPLFAARLLRLDEDDNVLIVAVDHIIADASSLDLLISEMWTLYGQGLSGAAALLPRIRAQLADYAVWQRKCRQAWLTEHDAYWSERLRGAARIRLPAEKVVAEVAGSNWAAAPIRICESLRAALSDHSRQEQSTLALSVLTAYTALVLRWCETRESIVGVVTTGRARPEILNTVGFFASTLYLRLELSARDTFRDLLHRVTAEYFTALAHQDFGLLPLSMAGAQLASSPNFNWYRSNPRQPAASNADGRAIKAQPFSVARAAREMEANDDLDIYGGEPWLVLTDTSLEIIGCVRYRPAHLPPMTMLRFGRGLQLLASKLVEEPRTRVVACPVLMNLRRES